MLKGETVRLIQALTCSFEDVFFFFFVYLFFSSSFTSSTSSFPILCFVFFFTRMYPHMDQSFCEDILSRNCMKDRRSRIGCRCALVRDSKLGKKKKRKSSKKKSGMLGMHLSCVIDYKLFSSLSFCFVCPAFCDKNLVFSL